MEHNVYRRTFPALQRQLSMPKVYACNGVGAERRASAPSFPSLPPSPVARHPPPSRTLAREPGTRGTKGQKRGNGKGRSRQMGKKRNIGKRQIEWKQEQRDDWRKALGTVTRKCDCDGREEGRGKVTLGGGREGGDYSQLRLGEGWGEKNPTPGWG